MFCFNSQQIKTLFSSFLCMIKITFLGTAAQTPTMKRNHTSILLNYNGENILVDCGEGTQRQFRKARLNPCKVTRLLITHWHGDHVFGIPGLLSTLALSGYNKTLFIYGPKGTKDFMNALLKIFKFTRKYEIKVKEVGDTQGCIPLRAREPATQAPNQVGLKENIQKNIFTRGKFLETDDFYLEAKSMEHGIPTNAYVFVKKGQIRIDKKKLKKSKLPYGPLLKKLKEGKDISYKGKKYLAKNLTYKVGDKKVAIVLDTKLNKNIVSLVEDSDLLICESSFGSDLQDKAKEHLHLTARQAAEIAKESKSKKLVLTHISQRYDKDPKKILNDAKKVFKKTSLVDDLDIVEV